MTFSNTQLTKKYVITIITNPQNNKIMSFSNMQLTKSMSS